MEMHQFVSPPLGNNVYLLWEGMPGKGAVIDPAMATDDILFYAKEHRIKILYIVNTHAHFDHVWENAKLKKRRVRSYVSGKGMKGCYWKRISWCPRICARPWRR